MNAGGSIVLLSGGLDSTTCLAIAKAELPPGQKLYSLSFDYGQRHRVELAAAAAIAQAAGAHHTVFKLDLRAFGGSALTGDIDVPKDAHDSPREEAPPGEETIPVTYVPARNIVFLSIASALAETKHCTSIYIGVNAVDYSGYPDCRPEFIAAFGEVIRAGTKAGVEGRGAVIKTPLISLTKSQIIDKGSGLGVDYSQTISCYDPNDQGEACGRCDACFYRKKGFAEAGVADPTRYYV